jgi:hypothetical protein
MMIFNSFADKVGIRGKDKVNYNLISSNYDMKNHPFICTKLSLIIIRKGQKVSHPSLLMMRIILLFLELLLLVSTTDTNVRCR